MKKPNRRLRRALVVFGGLLLMALAVSIWYSSALTATGAPEAEVTVKPGAATAEIARTLQEKKLIKSQAAFSWHVKLNSLAKDFKSGTYRLNGDKSAVELAHELTEGPKRANQFTIKEGVTQDEVASLLGKQGIVDEGEFKKLKAKDFPEYDFLKGLPEDATLQGFLFPETYTQPTEEAPAKEIAKIMLDQFAKEITPFESQIKKRGHSLYDTLIVASLVEDEVRSDEDRAVVAGIIYKRLQQGIRLDIDATTRYAVDKKPGQPLTQDDLNSGNPYNTRKVKGLPPGPIDNPSLSALKGAINPKQTDFLFYLSAKDGKTIFAKTNAEHEENVKKYLR